MEQELELYKKMYATLFNGITDALALWEQGDTTRAAVVLAAAQSEAERIFVNAAQ